jgi:hypothetical protein
MFTLVTALCCYLAWQMSIVRQRQSLLMELRTQPFVQVLTTDAWVKIQSPGPGGIVGAAHVPRTRQWLGDEAIQEISYARGYHHLNQAQIDRIKKVFAEANVHEYEALMEPCHPGCFPAGTLVQTPQGPRPIEGIRIGDPLLTILPDGRRVGVAVQSIFVTRNRLWRVATDDGSLLTTQTQPLCLASHAPLRAGDLHAGDRILRYVDGQVREATVHGAWATDRVEKVFNLVLGDSELFIAGGFVARSKPPADTTTVTD